MERRTVDGFWEILLLWLFGGFMIYLVPDAVPRHANELWSSVLLAFFGFLMASLFFSLVPAIKQRRFSLLLLLKIVSLIALSLATRFLIQELWANRIPLEKKVLGTVADSGQTTL